ncbi:DNA_repair and recombination protein Rhp26p [Hexamita inflata]|uniref:DNA repair and recombination protein Rhp26p n=1 Tax=Hexamita inflata TaxID=28002 RepID=A0AA86P018_9EUKA|nr:DNA repair and recombination protein Rhp26p [Hexamita inflata]
MSQKQGEQKQERILIKPRVSLDADFIPESLRPMFGKLFYYQKETVNWVLSKFLLSDTYCQANNNDPSCTLQFKTFQAVRGLLCGHSPGLGKTPISCFTLSVLFALNKIRFAMVIVPKTVTEQWRSHLNIWCPNAHVCVYNGPKRSAELAQLMESKKGIILTTYRTADIDADELTRVLYNNAEKQYNTQYKNMLKAEQEANEKRQKIQALKQKNDLLNNDKFAISISEDGSDIQEQIMQVNAIQVIPFRKCAVDLMILDEATEIKNESSSCHQRIKTISTFFKLALTGTPIMNNIKELYNIVNFLNQGYLGNRAHFVNDFDKQINVSRLKDATEIQKLVGRALQKDLIESIKPIFLRHTKEQVNALQTNKIEVIMWMSLSEVQNQIYTGFVSSKKFTNDLKQTLESKTVPFRLITILRKICENMMRLNNKETKLLEQEDKNRLTDEQKNYLNIIGNRVKLDDLNVDSDDEEAKQEVNNTILNNYFNQGVDSIIEQKSFQTLNKYCSVKQHLLTQLVLKFIQHKQKCLIFTEHTTTLNLIQLQLEDLGINFVRIDGSVTQTQKRQEICNSFNVNPQISCLLMTIKVGGMGLNLQAAQRVIIFSPNWNPSIEEQAVARAYRIGQKQDVVVYKLVVRNTIEEKLVARQFHKLQVADQVMQDMDAKVKVASGDITELFVRREVELEKLSLQNKEQQKQLLQQKLDQLIKQQNVEYNNQNVMIERRKMMLIEAAGGNMLKYGQMISTLNSQQHTSPELLEIGHQIFLAKQELARYEVVSLEDTLNQITDQSKIDFKSEKALLDEIIAANQEFNVSISVVQHSDMLKNKVDDDSSIEEIDPVQAQLEDGEPVYDAHSSKSYMVTKISDLRERYVQDVEQIERKHIEKQETEILPELKEIIDKRKQKSKNTASQKDSFIASDSDSSYTDSDSSDNNNYNNNENNDYNKLNKQREHEPDDLSSSTQKQTNNLNDLFGIFNIKKFEPPKEKKKDETEIFSSSDIQEFKEKDMNTQKPVQIIDISSSEFFFSEDKAEKQKEIEIDVNSQMTDDI